MSVSAPELDHGRTTRRSAPADLGSLIGHLVGVCAAHAPLVLVVAMLLCVASGWYVQGHFAMTTDTSQLLSPELPWRIRQEAFDHAFPQSGSDLVVVIDGATPELSEGAAARLAARLGAQTKLFRSVERPDAGSFWTHDALLFAPIADVRSVTAQLLKFQPFLGSMASDPSLRGFANTVSVSLQGVSSGQASAADLRAPLRNLAGALQAATLGQPAAFSWQSLITGSPPDRRELRHILLIDPVLDFSQLRAAKLPIDAIDATAKQLQLDSAHGVRVRVTGTVALEDDEFATLTQRAGLIACLACAAIVLMLWLAVRSPWVIGCILVTTLAGLLTATAIGLAVFHRFNVISVAFIPLFVGMGMDLGIQFSVRYRAERASGRDAALALVAAGESMGKSLTLAAAAIGTGFLAFAPTAYYGVSQLGMIAGIGMFAALALNLTLLPALIRLTRAPGAPVRRPNMRLICIDSYTLRHRRWVVGIGACAALISAVLLLQLRFDFNPIHVRSPRMESVATLLDLMNDPERSPNTLEVIRPNLRAADRLAATFRADPTVYGVRTLSSFIPAQQPEKIAVIDDAANLLDLTLGPVGAVAQPSDAEVVASLKRTAARLRQAAIDEPSLRADASRLAVQFDNLAWGDPSMRARATRMLVPSFLTTLARIRALLHPRPVSIQTLPRDIVRHWVAPDGHARVSILPKGDSNDNAVLRRFVASGLKIAPDATGPALYIQAYGRAVVQAFVQAGVLSFVAISCLLLIALRRVRDVAVTMAPIILTGLLTLGTCVLIGQPLNFANIIALPLLFGIGVAFHIYFVMSWRSGGSHLLTSSLARGVFFSALATATGFGSLWASKDPGTASMGELLMISLVWTLASALLFQPALMGLVGQRREAAQPTARDRR
ncbi:MAG TPA: MMPL family transporter [Steroidobacteraceae bacterium]|nr:MMPL family transporter [Steroidobacteraceae bacterium]